jgi:hypothetical protein
MTVPTSWSSAALSTVSPIANFDIANSFWNHWCDYISTNQSALLNQASESGFRNFRRGLLLKCLDIRVLGADHRRGNPVVSDIGINFPFWFIAGYFVVVGWYVSVPAIVVLGLVGYFVDMARGWRVAAFGGAALLSAPFVTSAVLTIIDDAKDKRFQADRAELHRSLEHDETVTGLALPAGSEIDFTDKSRTHILSVRLPVVTDIGGVQMTGALMWQDLGHVWQGTLAGDQIVGGLPCAAGLITFGTDGAVYECRLAAAHIFLGFALPPGTTVTRGADPAHWTLLLPENAGLVIPALAATAPAGATLHVTHDGRLESASSGNGATMVVRGVPLDSMHLYSSRRSRRCAAEGAVRGGGRNAAGGYSREHRPHDGGCGARRQELVAIAVMRAKPSPFGLESKLRTIPKTKHPKGLHIAGGRAPLPRIARRYYPAALAGSLSRSFITPSKRRSPQW